MATITYNLRQARYLKPIHDSLDALNTEVGALAAGSDPASAKMTYAAGLGTVAGAGTAVKLVAVTTASGDANLWTVGTDNTMTATFLGTRAINVKARLILDVASGADAVTLHVYVDGASVFETASQAITAASPLMFEIDEILNVANGETVEIYVENEDEIVNVTSGASAERVNTTPSSGWMKLVG